MSPDKLLHQFAALPLNAVIDAVAVAKGHNAEGLVAIRELLKKKVTENKPIAPWLISDAKLLAFTEDVQKLLTTGNSFEFEAGNSFGILNPCSLPGNDWQGSSDWFFAVHDLAVNDDLESQGISDLRDLDVAEAFFGDEEDSLESWPESLRELVEVKFSWIS